MSVTTDRRTTTDEPQPWRTPEDRKGWHSVPRTRRNGQVSPPLVSVEVDFNREQSDWLSAECDRTGLNYVTLVKKLVEDARAADQRP
jgi:hypothetical protein